MLPEDPSALTDDQLAELLPQLTDQQLSDVLDRLEAAEVISKQRDVDMGVSAAWYAVRLGWPVFPLKPRGKQPLTQHGFKDATTDPDRIAEWWQQWPDANIGIPTGLPDQGGCGYDVVDIDGPQGMRDWHSIKHQHCPTTCSDVTFCPAPGPFDVHAIAFTPGGPGRHLYVPATGKGNATRLGGKSIDWRGTGGYVVAPPSVGLSGVRYAWLSLPTPPPGEALRDVA